ncbi:MAG: tetratricopeptide repeat protein [Crocinitomicaceae bacterium]|nr:tetratricopeptide repeat protein [Crocinitomicaceae bacterium]
MSFFNRYLALFFLVFCLFTASNCYGQQSREEQLIRAYEAEPQSKKKFKRLMALGEYYKESNIHLADSIQHIILSESRNFEDSLRFNALFFSAEIAECMGDQDEYFRKILACQPFISKLNSDDVLFKVYRHLGYYHSSILESETADFYLNLALRIAKKNRSNEKLSEAYNYLAKNFMMQNEKDSSLMYVERAIRFGRRNTNKTILAKAFNTQAEIYDFFGQVELSVAKNLISLKLVEEVQNIYLIAKLSREIGQEQALILNLDDAELYFRRSLKYATQIHDFRQMALALSHLASVQLKRSQFELATKNANLAISYLSQLNDANGLGKVHNILGMVYQEQQNYDEASINFNKALVYYESSKNREKIAGVYHNVGTVFKQQGKYRNALNYLNRSIEIRSKFGAKNQIYNTYRVIADVYKEINDTQKSIEYLELYLNYIDSNTTIQAATKIAELSESYRSEQRERLINSQADSIERERQRNYVANTKLENSQLKNNFQMYIIIAFLIIIILAGIVLFYRWNQTKIKQEQKETEMSQRVLRAQMNPHFVFNAMSVIQSYIYENDIENSTKFLVNFSRLMRLILENSPKEFIPIRTEIEILQKYLETQKLRFEDRFQFEIVAGDSVMDEFAIIPPMITQPFIENSIEHGQLHTIEGGFIRVLFEKKDDMLHISIRDNGIGRKASRLNKKSSAHKSMAMEITRERIDNLNNKYKTEGYLTLEDFDKKNETGTNVLISLPYNVEPNS